MLPKWRQSVKSPEDEAPLSTKAPVSHFSSRLWLAAAVPPEVFLCGMNQGIIIGSMKTAISIDDGLLQEADQTARLMGLSRSRLFSLAVGDFLQRQRREQMLLRLNEVYADSVEPSERRLLKGIKAKVRRTAKERW